MQLLQLLSLFALENGVNDHLQFINNYCVIIRYLIFYSLYLKAYYHHILSLNVPPLLHSERNKNVQPLTRKGNIFPFWEFITNSKQRNVPETTRGLPRCCKQAGRGTKRGARNEAPKGRERKEHPPP